MFCLPLKKITIILTEHLSNLEHLLSNYILYFKEQYEIAREMNDHLCVKPMMPSMARAQNSNISVKCQTCKLIILYLCGHLGEMRNDLKY